MRLDAGLVEDGQKVGAFGEPSLTTYGCHRPLGQCGVHPRDVPPLTSALRLRYSLCMALLDARYPRTITELIEAAAQMGNDLRGRPSKVVSDALRWEVRRGRAVRVARSVYRAGSMPRSTEWWIRERLADDRRRAATEDIVAQRLAISVVRADA